MDFTPTQPLRRRARRCETCVPVKPSSRLAALLFCATCGPFAGFLAQAQSSHHSADGFHNNYPHDPKASFWVWKWEQLRQGMPEPPPGGWQIAHVKTDAAALAANDSRPTVTWIGHSAFLIQLAGKNVLVDPQFSERASPVAFAGPKRIVPLPIDIAELPPIDLVLISHNHYDHLDLATVKRLASMTAGSPHFLVPLGLKSWFNDQGIERVEELDWWQAREAGPLRLTLVPVQHWSKRTLFDTNQTLWGGWVIEGGGLKLVHTGDLGRARRASGSRGPARRARHRHALGNIRAPHRRDEGGRDA